MAVTPGFRKPDDLARCTISSGTAVRVVVPKAKVNQLMDDLYEVGARGIIVTASAGLPHVDC